MQILPASLNTIHKNFKAVYYTRMSLSPSDVLSNVSQQDSFKYILDKNPSESLKDVVENTLFFRDLSEGTDLFVTSLFSEDTNTPAKTGMLKVIFKDPYCKKESIDEINLQTVGFSKNIIFEKFKKIVDGLPMYNVLKNKNSDKSLIKLGEKFSNEDGFVFVDL